MSIVSIIIPFYQAHQTLPAAVNSILSQTYKDFELLLINDGSTDTKKLELPDDHRIRMITIAHQGVANAMNIGIKVSKGRYIARMDADDIALPERIAVQTKFLNENTNIDVVAGQAIFRSRLENAEGLAYFVNWNNNIVHQEAIYLNRFVEFPLIQPTMMYRKEVFNKAGLFKQGDFPEDYEHFLRLMDQHIAVAKVREKLIYWHDHSNRLTRNDDRYRTEAFYRIKTLYLTKFLERHNPFHPNVVVWGAGRISRKRAELLKAHGIKIIKYIDIDENLSGTIPCISYLHLPPPGQFFILSYVANRGARVEIRRYLHQKGYKENVDFLLL